MSILGNDDTTFWAPGTVLLEESKSNSMPAALL